MKAPKPPEAAPGSLQEKLQILRDILPVWKERLPRAPDPNLIPSEADAARREDLREIRGRMLLRRANHEAFTQEFDELSGLFAQV